MRLLVIGGTVFVGRAAVDAALDRGHEVTIFHRGEHGEDVHPEVEHVHGDRTSDLSLLSGRKWDAVIDTCGFTADDVGASATALVDVVSHYTFVSSVSVYAEWPAARVDETSRVFDDSAPAGYGADKARAERAVQRVLGERALVVRPGLIVGPHENIGRLPFWLGRVAAGGQVLAPAPANASRQWIDTRDLGEWMVLGAEQQLGGVFNAVDAPGRWSMGELLDTCRDVTQSEAEFVWADGEAIVSAGIAPWSELPIWLWEADKDVTATWHVDAGRAHAAGLAPRPMRQTVVDTWAWLQAEPGFNTDYRREFRVVPLDPQREAAALANVGAQPAGTADGA
ncbi:MAG: NAD-dependent epimerase/dehydratase family protein [Mycobacteriales bacterium]|nr:NAD-dependent epimerase/dehydratase family protein [Frankia sp.]